MSTQDRAAKALNVPLLKFVGAKPLDEHELSKGLQLTWSPDVLNAVGGIHAGALATTLEVTAYLALLPQLAESEEAVTHDFSASYVAAVSPGAILTFTGNVLRRGRNVAFISVEARAEGELVAIAHVTKSIRKEGKTPPSIGRNVSRT